MIDTSSRLKNSFRAVLLVVIIFAGFFLYDVVSYYVIARHWFPAVARVTDFPVCQHRRRGGPSCLFALDYTYAQKAYTSKQHLSRIYSDQLLHMEPGTKSESIAIPIRIKPTNPEKIMVDKKDDIHQIGYTVLFFGAIAGAIALILYRMGYRGRKIFL